MDGHSQEYNTTTTHVDEAHDEFFGDQDEDGDFGKLGRHEDHARNEQLKTIGYLESFDETKDSLLQPGFEAGYRETYEVSKSLGKNLGRMIAEHQLLVGIDAIHTTPSDSIQSAAVSRRIHEFLSQFQNRPSNVPFDAKNSIVELQNELFHKIEE